MSSILCCERCSVWCKRGRSCGKTENSDFITPRKCNSFPDNDISRRRVPNLRSLYGGAKVRFAFTEVDTVPIPDETRPK
ncbi:hypothetical protein TNIN_334251 [Trichonephila inaurata madagascariensis]|uniref:Uncharacterized protein n=1 Tax=Trichonephila inaurata madagascariensis TaxID=2747483 RepID=A0A8X7C5F6_9ARAC|nr:hypothetical protein TNIN_334251 [Trichonephila inaurata madagascariensis]